MFIIFDKDGTLVDSIEGVVPMHVTKQVLRPRVLEVCQLLLARDYQLGVASNQGGVGLDYLTELDAEEMVRDVAEKIGAEFWTFCPYHPAATIPRFRQDNPWCRKPNPGMINELMEKAGATQEFTTYVGDRAEDHAAALAAGVEFQWAWEIFL